MIGTVFRHKTHTINRCRWKSTYPLRKQEEEKLAKKVSRLLLERIEEAERTNNRYILTVDCIDEVLNLKDGYFIKN